MPPLHKALRVLFVDHEKSLQEFMRIDLHALGHQVTVCPDGKVALKELERTKFDGAILDLRMPVMTGLELLEQLKAIQVDFAPILERKNAVVSLRQIIRELEESQKPVHSPIILNGSPFGFFANHSLVMANYISRANAAIIDLRELLRRG